MDANQGSPGQASAVLVSGGLDSAVLLVEETARGDVQPVYVSTGLAWEKAERTALTLFLEHLPGGTRVRPLVSLTLDMRDVYGPAHWSVQGAPPAYHTADEEVYLPGRNIVLLGKAGVFCATAGIERLVMGSLAHNPFPDATPAFRSAMGIALSEGLGARLDVDAPYADVSKAEVIRRGANLGVPFELTLSCMSPVGVDIETGMPLHCGTCSKCRERHDGFVESGVSDPTRYVDTRFVHA
ncbi:MAG TPA: 7-cyano-7-deazaguanine synthase [Vicinamibacterales bacterium]|nr:7-cyano-7-deazaguanine synthase [Vicinamibacterales bacterium]